MRPFSALLDRLRRPDPPPPLPLPPTMSDGARDFQSRLDEARERLRREIPPPPPDEE